MTLPATREHDPALEVLFHAIDTGALPWPRAGGALFLRARDGWPLHAAGRTGLVCEQTFKPAFDALQRSQLRGACRSGDRALSAGAGVAAAAAR